jgi:hypothetical protein
VLYHATGKVTGVKVCGQQPLVTVERRKLPSAPVSFTVNLTQSVRCDGSLVYELRDRQNRVLQKGILGDFQKSASFAPALPCLPQGTYVVDVWALQRGAVLDWASVGLVVTGEQYVAGIEPAKEYYGRTEAITGTVKWKYPPGRGMSASVELWDTYDRLVATVKPDLRTGQFRFVPMQHPLSRTYRLVAKAMEKGWVVDQKERWVGLPSNEVDDYQFLMWGVGLNTRANRTFMHQCRQYGVTGYYDLTTWCPPELISESADRLARNNLLAYPYCYGLWAFHIGPPDNGGHGGTFEEIIQRDVKAIYPTRAAAYRRYGTMAYSVCEESYIERDEKKWANPKAAADYARYLQERYGDIGKLNEIWKSQFKTFEEIGTVPFMEAKTSRQYTRWMEQELYKVDRFNQVHEVIHKTIQSLDPGATVSLDCTGGMDYDWPRMAKIIHAGTQSPLESFNRTTADRFGTWFGSYSYMLDEWVNRTLPWRYLFQGGTHLTWFGYAFTPDFSEPLLHLQWASEEFLEIEKGPGRLLMASAKRVDPILIMWSNPSYYASILNPLDVAWEDARGRFENMLRREGLDYRMVGAEFVDKELSYGPSQKVLVLPACQAISRQGGERIKAFAQAGGLVIADYPPALMDEYLRPYGEVKAGGEAVFETCAKCQGTKRIEVGNVWQPCPACGGTGQTLKGGAVLTKSSLDDLFDLAVKGARPCGKGNALFLKGSPDQKEEWGALRSTLIERGGIAGDIEVGDALGNPRTDVRSYVFDNGPAMLLGLILDNAYRNPPGEELTLKLKRTWHVYDVRRHQYLGETTCVQTGILPCEPKLLAFLPERMEAMQVSLAKQKYKPGDVVELKGAPLPASLKDIRFAVRIEVSKGGKVQEAYTKNVVVQGGFAHSIPLALNQEKGVYHAVTTEIISGYTQEVEFTVR